MNPMNTLTAQIEGSSIGAATAAAVVADRDRPRGVRAAPPLGPPGDGPREAGARGRSAHHRPRPRRLGQPVRLGPGRGRPAEGRLSPPPRRPSTRSRSAATSRPFERPSTRSRARRSSSAIRTAGWSSRMPASGRSDVLALVYTAALVPDEGEIGVQRPGQASTRAGYQPPDLRSVPVRVHRPSLLPAPTSART